MSILHSNPVTAQAKDHEQIGRQLRNQTLDQVITDQYFFI